jgi:hypothetical protein
MSSTSTYTSVVASCAALLAAVPTTPSGIYTIDPLLSPDGSGAGAEPLSVYCDMTTDGGGWTTFLAGQEGSPYVFNHFELTTADCVDPANKCVRRLPSTATTSTWIAATCGSYAVKFNPGTDVLAYLVSGTQRGWAPNTNVTALAPGSNVAFANDMFTGLGSNYGWILSNTTDYGNDQPSTFSSSYNLNSGWDYCNGTPGTGSVTRLMYR